MYGGRSNEKIVFKDHATNYQGVCAQYSSLLVQQCQDTLPKEDPKALVDSV